jgi:hypothetical protein
LDRTPATDLIDGTVMAWHEAITTGRTFDQRRDTDRIRAAFVTLATTRESWPQPKHFLDALPRVEQAALRYEVKPASPQEAAAALARIREMLGEPVPAFKPEKPKREGPPIAEVERELAAHYGTGKMAAAGPDA